MGQERNLGAARAIDDSSDEEKTKAELQRQMEQARESISHTVSEIKDTVATQYQHVKESVTDALDWREQFRKRPVAWSVGALSAGLLVGYGVGAAAFNSDDDDKVRYVEVAPKNSKRASNRLHSGAGSRNTERTYSHDIVTAGAYGADAQDLDNRPSYSSGYTPEIDEPEGPGILERVKSTGAYNRLEAEVANLGSSFVDQLAKVGHEVLLPAVLAKLLSIIGVENSTSKQKSSADNNVRSAAATASGLS